MHWGSRVFVFIVFAVLAASFWATTVNLYLEFRDPNNPFAFEGETWFALLTHYSDLFIFFPVFGTVALIAFFTPACTFVDMYWHQSRQQDEPIPQSRFRFVLGFAVVIVGSALLSDYIQSGAERSIWQLSKTTLQNDKGDLCTEDHCARVSFVDGLNNVRRLSRVRTTVTDMERVCQPDAFIQPPRQAPRSRYCAASTNFQGKGGDLEGRWQNDDVCCIAQGKFDDAVKLAHADPAKRSETDKLQRNLWPLNIFFLLILLVISILLALRRTRIERYYAEYARSIDGGVIVGVLAMAFLAVMNGGFIEATQLLHGTSGAASPHREPQTFIVLFAIWALLILFSFVHPANKQAELTSRVLGVIFSVLFVFNADTITNYGIRYLGAGAGIRALIGVMIAAALLVGLIVVLSRMGVVAAAATLTSSGGAADSNPQPVSDGPKERAG